MLADILGFTLEFRKRFRAMTDCGMRSSHSDAGNLRSVLAKPDKNNFFEFLYHVQQYFCGGCVEEITDILFFSSWLPLTQVMLCYLKDRVPE